MNVNNTIKIHDLARELLKKGLVHTLEQGIEQATTALGIQEEVEAQAEAPKQESPKQENQNKVDIVERKLNYLAKSFAEQFNAEMGAVKKQIEMLNNELRSLRQDMKTNKVQQPIQEKQKQTERPKEEEVKPRTGDLKPENVDLDSYFYFGNKKK